MRNFLLKIIAATISLCLFTGTAAFAGEIYPFVEDAGTSPITASTPGEYKEGAEAKAMTDIQPKKKQVLMYRPVIYGEENFADAAQNLDVYFYEELPSVAYLELSESAALLYSLTSQIPSFAEAEFDYYSSDGFAGITRENGASVYFSAEENSITFTDYDLFFSLPKASCSLDIIEFGLSDSSQILAHKATSYIKGTPVCIDLSEYGISLIKDGDKLYVPLATFSDLFVSQIMGLCWVYNGEAVFELSNSSLLCIDEDGLPALTPVGELYYSSDGNSARPDDLAQFTYKELCLALDFHYGLKDEHGITNFNEYFTKTGLFDSFLTTDPDKFYEAMEEFTILYLEDGHTCMSAEGFNSKDPLSSNGSTAAITSATKLVIEALEYENARSSFGIYAADGYSEYGDTAYVCFDTFSTGCLDYTDAELVNDPTDTIMLILYSHAQITRENSPIKNVVVDLTNNKGGALDSAICLLSWFLGEAPFSPENVATKAKGTLEYTLDTNRDGVYDSRDSLGEYNKYCLISTQTFSAANLAASVFKASDDVTLIGLTSGGGACVSRALSTADGCLFTCSGQVRMNSAESESFYNPDGSVEPDIYIDDIANLYDRKFITNLINSPD